VSLSAQFRSATGLLPLRTDRACAAQHPEQGGYDAYFGTYTVDDAQGIGPSGKAAGALSPENVGLVLTRAEWKSRVTPSYPGAETSSQEVRRSTADADLETGGLTSCLTFPPQPTLDLRLPG